jgi:hypothetical protein
VTKLCDAEGRNVAAGRGLLCHRTEWPNYVTRGKRRRVAKGRQGLVSDFGTVVADLFTVLVLPDISVQCCGLRHNVLTDHNWTGQFTLKGCCGDSATVSTGGAP